MKISEHTKRLIIEKVIAQSYLNQFYFKEDFVAFLSRLLPLRDLPSTDPRYSNAEGDCHQHLVNNEDWDIHYLFTQRFDFISDPVKFEALLNLIVNPEFCTSIDDLQMIVIQTNRYLEKENHQYIITDYTSENLPVYQIIESSPDLIETSHRKNEIPVFVNFSPTAHFTYNNTHPIPSVFPSFNMVLNNGWNDYGLVSLYCLFYFDNDGMEHKIGELKIINDSIKSVEGNTSLSGILPDKFHELDFNFCSLGQTISFYTSLKSYLGSQFEHFLWAIKDCAFFPILLDKFESHTYFKSSLIRNDEQEQLLREAKTKVYGLDPNSLYSFIYKFHQPFSNQENEINLNFRNDYYFNRIYCVIGKNGVGKTQFISKLPQDISKNKKDKFYPNRPDFSKVIAVSYSAFDSFEIPNSNSQFNYVFCGLKGKDGNPLTDLGLVNRFHFSWKKIKEKNRFNVWVKLLLNFIEEDFLFQMFDETNEFLNLPAFRDIRKKLSSGQTLLLYIITEVVANIRHNSFLLYDEPETHLHPNAISQLINTVFDLLEKFDSYCIITTHSPLIIREVISKNVFVFERTESYFKIKQLPIETFGENLTTITDEIFGNRVFPNNYKNVLEKLVEQNLSYDQITEKISGSLPLSLSASLYLQNLLDEKE
jgi:ABC-type multidrug transport system ATPase subunit